ncbi:MAG: acetyltransferase [Microscillaceae bacterium]|nr:acetyltransferase [Microscillaceae bacterium]
MLIYGAGGHAGVIAYCLKVLGIPIEGVFDDDPAIQYFENIQVNHVYDVGYLSDQQIILALGNNRVRQTKATLIKHNFGKITHPSAQIYELDQMGEGSVAFQYAVLQVGATLGKHVILNTGAIVEHDCKVEDFVHLAPRSTLCGEVKVGEGSLIGAGAVILPGIKIGQWCVVGAGSVVTKDLPDFSTVVGIPAKVAIKVE